MNRRITGFLLAVAAVLTSLIVLLRAEKPRRFLQARVEQARHVLPKPKQAQESTQHLSTRVSHVAKDVKGTTAQAMSKVKHASSDLAKKAKQLVPASNRDER